MAHGFPGKNTRNSDRIGRFSALADDVTIDGIRELGKSDPQAAYMAAQQLAQEMQQQQAAQQQQMAQQQQALDQGEEFDGPSKPEDEMNSEKALQLQAQLPFKKQLANVQQLMMDLENELRARQTPTPKPGMG